MDAVVELAPVVGVAPLCTALGLPRATYYRSLGRTAEPVAPPPPPPALVATADAAQAVPAAAEPAGTKTPKKASPRALSERERGSRLGDSQRGALLQPGAGRGVRDPARRGQVSVLGAHDVSHPQGQRAGARTQEPASSPAVHRPRADGHPAQPAVELGHHEAQDLRQEPSTCTCTSSSTCSRGT